MKFAPVLLLQLVYKSIWFACVVLPAIIATTFYPEASLFAIIWATFVVGDLIALPSKSLLKDD